MWNSDSTQINGNDRSAICVPLSKIIVSACRHYPFMRSASAPCTSMAPKSTIPINTSPFLSHTCSNSKKVHAEEQRTAVTHLPKHLEMPMHQQIADPPCRDLSPQTYRVININTKVLQPTVSIGRRRILYGATRNNRPADEVEIWATVLSVNG